MGVQTVQWKTKGSMLSLQYRRPSLQRQNSTSNIQHIGYDIVYDIGYDIVYDLVCDIFISISTYSIRYRTQSCTRYRIRYIFSSLPLMQDTLCLVAPYPFRLEPLHEFDPLSDFDMTGGDDVWYARPRFFFCALAVPRVIWATRAPTGRFRWCSSARLKQSIYPETASCRGMEFPCCTSGQHHSSQLSMSAPWRMFLAVFR